MVVYADFHVSSVYLVGNGQHSCQLHQQLVTCIFTRFTTSSSRPSKCHMHQDDVKMGNISVLFLKLNERFFIYEQLKMWKCKGKIKLLTLVS